MMPKPLSLEAVLLCLFRHGPNYGTGLSRELETLSPSLSVSPGSLYPALRELEAASLLSSCEEPGGEDRRGRPRRFYKLTAAGRRRANELARLYEALAGTEAA